MKLKELLDWETYKKLKPEEKEELEFKSSTEEKEKTILSKDINLLLKGMIIFILLNILDGVSLIAREVLSKDLLHTYSTTFHTLNYITMAFCFFGIIIATIDFFQIISKRISKYKRIKNWIMERFYKTKDENGEDVYVRKDEVKKKK